MKKIQNCIFISIIASQAWWSSGYQGCWLITSDAVSSPHVAMPSSYNVLFSKNLYTHKCGTRITFYILVNKIIILYKVNAFNNWCIIYITSLIFSILYVLILSCYFEVHFNAANMSYKLNSNIDDEYFLAIA